MVGAGPGNGGLMTLKGAERLRNADVVLYDRFVGEEILEMIPLTAERIDVGKNAGNHPVPQDEINRLLLEKAKQGLEVVRLKGGDPFVFGRGCEELEHLLAHGVPFEVVPGVTSAVAGAAYAGIPVTHRRYASSLHIVTAHAKNNEAPDIRFDALVGAGGTLVFLMGVSAIGDICAGCLKAGMDKDMPAALVENATTGAQRKFLGTVSTLPELAARNNVASPAVIVIGEVCRLSEEFDWFGKKPLLGRRVIVARAKPGESKLSEGLRELGCGVTVAPCAGITPLTGSGSPLREALENIDGYSWLVFTSGVGVKIFFDYLTESGMDIRRLHHLRVACVGAETEKEARRRGVFADYRPEEYNGAAMARGLVALVRNGERVLIARAKDGAAELTRILETEGVSFDDIAVYQKNRDTALAAAIQNIAVEGADFAAFTSSSAVDMFAEALSCTDLGGIKAVCIGERTASAARALGMETHVSEAATIESMIEKIKELCA